MRKAILPLLIIITMVLSASVASATDFAASGAINIANGWTTTGDWQQKIEDGTFTESEAWASHPVYTGASGAFDFIGKFRITDLRNEVKIGLIAGDHEYAIEYKNNKFWFDGAVLGSYPSGLSPTSTLYPHIKSTDGKVWEVSIYSFKVNVNVNDAPTAIVLGGKDNTGSLKASPVFYTPLVFESAGEPAAPPVEEPEEQPATGGSSSPVYNIAEVQDFYQNIYPLIGSPYDTVTYNADGTYSVTKGYPTSSTYDVTGSVTSAADGSPISGASVVLGDAMQKTGNDGKFTFGDVSGGSADIAISADGFASKTEKIGVYSDLALNFALDKVATSSATIASAQNETGNMTADTNATMPANATVAPTMAPTEAPAPTQTQSPGFEGIIAAIAMIGAAGVLVYLNRKR